jgi:hypothetical protein
MHILKSTHKLTKNCIVLPYLHSENDAKDIGFDIRLRKIFPIFAIKIIGIPINTEYIIRPTIPAPVPIAYEEMPKTTQAPIEAA